MYMKKHFHQVIKNPLISGSTVIFAGSLSASVLNFLFNLFMTRNLSVSDYGILASLISIMTLSGLPAGSFFPMVVKFAGSYFAKNEYHLVRSLFFKVIKLSGSLGIIVLLIFIVFSKTIGEFFNISNLSLIIIISFIVFLGYIGIINNALLQAKLAFRFIASLNLLSAFLKLSIGAILVIFGLKVNGAIWGFFVASLVPYVLSFIPLRFIFEKEAKPSTVNFKEIVQYGGPAALALFGIASFVTTDIILTKHFFNPKEAGIYAGLSLIGRVIFFFSAPIGTVMFPLVVQKHAKKENYQNTFWLSVLIILVPSIALTIFYFIFPEFVIKFFLKNEEYLVSAPLLGFFGIFITVYSLLSIIVNFYLSTNKVKVWIPVVLAACLQALGIWMYHKTYFQVISISLWSSGLLLIGLLIYYFLYYGRVSKK